MYNNLLHQNAIVQRMKKDLDDSALPPAILFSGPAISGKLTAALETARIRCCREGADWRCSCNFCNQHRSLSHPRTILTGYRDLIPDIAACSEVLRRNNSVSSRFLLVRAARKLLRRFDPLLWEGSEAKIAKLRAVMERLSESVDSLLPGSDLPQEAKLEKILNKLLADCLQLQKALPSLLPVAQVRLINAWTTHSAGNDNKTVIIDSADRMLPASKNAMLKFLEEPPANTTIILITERKSLLLPTIISRLRDYSFRKRSPSEEAEVLRRVFREDENRYPSLSNYFHAWRSGPSEHLTSLAVEFLDSIAGSDIPKGIEKISDHIEFSAFLEALSIELQSRWHSDHPSSQRIHVRQMEWLRSARIRAESLNLPIRLIIRGLHASLGSSK